jgi:hypothetical protein
LVLTAALVWLGGAGAQAQTTAPHVGELKRYYYEA